MSTGDDFIHSSVIISLVQILATREWVVPLKIDPIMLATLIWLFRHLKHQDPSSNGWDTFYVSFIASSGAVVLLPNDPIMLGTVIRLFRHLEHQNLSSNGWDDFSSIFGHQGGSGISWKGSYHVGEIDIVVWMPWRSKSVHYFRFYRLSNMWQDL